MWYNRLTFGPSIRSILAMIISPEVAILVMSAVGITWLVIAGYAADTQAISGPGGMAKATSEYRQNADVRDTVTKRYETQIAELHQQVIDTQQALDTVQTMHIRNEENEFTLELAKKYWYVVRDASTGKGVTSDLIAFTDSICKEKNINPHLVWAIVHHESRYIATATNPRSNARGLGQFLESTAREVYQKYLGLGSYTHALAYDPYLNITMMVEYLDTIRGWVKTPSTPDVLAVYGGMSGTRYYAELKEYTIEIGCDISAVNYV